MGHRVKHYTAAGTYTLHSVHVLERVLVNTGNTATTLTIRYANDDQIAVMEIPKPGVDREIGLELNGADLEIVLSDTADITVIYD